MEVKAIEFHMIGPYDVGPTWYTQCRLTHPIPVEFWASVAAYCWFDTSQSCSTLAPNIETELGDCPVFALTAIGCTDDLSPERPLLGYHDTL